MSGTMPPCQATMGQKSWVRNHRDACQETGPECQQRGPEYQETRPECRHTVLAGYELANSLSHALQFWPFEHLDCQL